MEQDDSFELGLRGALRAFGFDSRTSAGHVLSDPVIVRHLIGAGEAAVQLDEPEILSDEMHWLARVFLTRGGQAEGWTRYLSIWTTVTAETAPVARRGPVADVLQRMLHLGEVSALTGQSQASQQAVDLARALVSGRTRQSRELLEAAHGGSHDAQEFHRSVQESLTDAMHLVGEQWELGAIGIGEEHVASRVVREILNGLRHHSPALGHSTARPQARKILVTLPPEQSHELGAQMAADRLTAVGHDVVYVGANTPETEIVRLAETFAVSDVLLSIGMVQGLHTVKRIQSALRSLAQPPRLLVGGRAIDRYPELAQRLVGKGHTVTLESVCSMLDPIPD